MHELDELVEGTNPEPRTFHPVHEHGPDAWFPGNEAASLLIQVGHIWEDISHLKGIQASQTDKYTKQLILKYVVIEVRSLIDVFDRLASLAMKAPVFDPSERQGWREITEKERENLASLLKEYSRAKSKVAKTIVSVRNEVGAHRGNTNWQEVRRFWEAISPDLINPLLASVPPAFEYIKELDLFEWNRVLKDGAHEFIGAQIRPGYFKWEGGDET